MTITTFDQDANVQGRPAAGDREAGSPGWANELVRVDPGATSGVLARRALAGLGLSALYGVAIGARQGGHALFVHAVGVPIGLVLVAVLGAPSMFVFLSLCRVRIDGRAMAAMTARGVGSAGVLLSGLAPAAALFVVSSEAPAAARFAVVFGLVLGGGVALARTVWDVVRSAFAGRAGAGVTGVVIGLGFAVFAVALAVRVWSSVLPVLGGAS